MDYAKIIEPNCWQPSLAATRIRSDTITHSRRIARKRLQDDSSTAVTDGSSVHHGVGTMRFFVRLQYFAKRIRSPSFARGYRGATSPAEGHAFSGKNGTVEAVEQAEVRSRVRGFVEKIAFEPGQEVQVGDVLYRIEKQQYEAEKNSAEASLAAAGASIKVAQAFVKIAEAELTRVSRELDRQKNLLRKKATSQAEFDTVTAGHVSGQANLDSAQAGVETAIAESGKAAAKLEQAQLDLSYTVVVAPIAGRITKTAIKQGNLVENGTVLAAIVDARKVYVNFHISDREILRYRELDKRDLILAKN